MALIFMLKGLQIIAARANPLRLRRIAPGGRSGRVGGRPSGAIGCVFPLKCPRNLPERPHMRLMNRRQFTRSLAALGLAPALPALPSMAAAAASAPPAYTPYMYGLGAHIARSTGLCSADLLARKLALHPVAAQAMQAQLVANGVLSAPNTAGLAVASQPYMASVRFKAASAATGKSARRFLRKALDPSEGRDDIPAGTTTDIPSPDKD